MPQRIASWFRVFTLLMVVVGCSDSTGPALPDLTGTWTYSASGLSGGGRNCTLAPFTLTITQTQAILSGSTSGGTLTCTNPNQTIALQVFQITEGEVSRPPSGGPIVDFKLVNGIQQWWHLFADIENSGRRIADRVTLFGFGSAVSGDFVMVKQ